MVLVQLGSTTNVNPIVLSLKNVWRRTQAQCSLPISLHISCLTWNSSSRCSPLNWLFFRFFLNNMKGCCIYRNVISLTMKNVIALFITLVLMQNWTKIVYQWKFIFWVFIILKRLQNFKVWIKFHAHHFLIPVEVSQSLIICGLHLYIFGYFLRL